MREECKIDAAAKIGSRVQLGYGVRIYGNVEVGDDCRIDDFSVVGCPGPKGPYPPLKLGSGARIRSHAVLYEGLTVGPELETGHHVVIREQSQIGDNLRIGNFCDIEGACRIGDFTRLHGYVHVGRGSSIGDFVWLFSLATLMNDPLPPSHLSEPVIIEDMVTVCVNAQCMPGVHIGLGALIACGAMASGRIPPGVVVTGAEGKIVGNVRFLMHMASRTQHPWHRHFSDVYPERARKRIEALGAKLDAISTEIALT